MNDVINGVSRKLLERVCSKPKACSSIIEVNRWSIDQKLALGELRALLTAQESSFEDKPQASEDFNKNQTAQSAPAGEREAFQEAATSFSLPLDESTHRGTFYEDDRTFWMHRGWQACAARRRTQSAGVPELQRKADLFDQYAGEAERLGFSGIGDALDALAAAPAQPAQPALTVWEGAMPESNGKYNFTAVLMRKGADLFDGISGGMTISRSEYPDRVRYEADCVRWLIGELKEEPCIVDYDAEKHSGYVAPTQPAAIQGGMRDVVERMTMENEELKRKLLDK